MPIVEQGHINWATLVEGAEIEVEFHEGFKKVIEYKTEDDGKKYKITNIFRIEKVKVPRCIAERKNVSKFGAAENDPSGINPATTVVSDEVFMQFLTNKEDEKSEVVIAPLPLVKCRFCKGDHWTAKCPHKEMLQDRVTEPANPVRSESTGGLNTGGTGVYKAPGSRLGATGSVMPGGRGGKFDMGKGDDYTIRVTNLPEEAIENDLMELFKPFGKVNRVYLAKDKNTQASRGFAFVNFQIRDDAQRAIWGVNDYGYNHLILKVEWAKPSNSSAQ